MGVNCNPWYLCSCREPRIVVTSKSCCIAFASEYRSGFLLHSSSPLIQCFYTVGVKTRPQQGAICICIMLALQVRCSTRWWVGSGCQQQIASGAFLADLKSFTVCWLTAIEFSLWSFGEAQSWLLHNNWENATVSCRRISSARPWPRTPHQLRFRHIKFSLKLCLENMVLRTSERNRDRNAAERWYHDGAKFYPGCLGINTYHMEINLNLFWYVAWHLEPNRPEKPSFTKLMQLDGVLSHCSSLSLEPAFVLLVTILKPAASWRHNN